MPVTDVTTDAEALTMTITAEFPAPVERLWEAFTDPRQLERFWGPPGYPATFTSFDLTVGGRARYLMTSPRARSITRRGSSSRSTARARSRCWTRSPMRTARSLEDMPTSRMTFTFEPTSSGTRLESVTRFTSADALEQVVAMGMVEGTTMAINQLDRVLQGLRDVRRRARARRPRSSTTRTCGSLGSSTGPIDLVWRAHQEPELLEKWMLGPDGWRMSVCEVDPAVGGRYRYEWEPLEGTEGERFGFDGETVLRRRRAAPSPPST